MKMKANNPAVSIRVAAVLITALVAAGVTYAAQQWTELGPAPTGDADMYTGRVFALACSLNDPDLYFAGGADGGVWRTRDGGVRSRSTRSTRT